MLRTMTALPPIMYVKSAPGHEFPSRIRVGAYRKLICMTII